MPAFLTFEVLHMNGKYIFFIFTSVFIVALVFYWISANVPGIYYNPLPTIQTELETVHSSTAPPPESAASPSEESRYSFPKTPSYVPPEAGENPVISKLPEGSIININQATMFDFMALPGIGEVTAKKIIIYRESIGGKFTSVEQLIEVNGIGEKKMEQIRPHVTV